MRSNPLLLLFILQVLRVCKCADQSRKSNLKVQNGQLETNLQDEIKNITWGLYEDYFFASEIELNRMRRESKEVNPAHRLAVKIVSNETAFNISKPEKHLVLLARFKKLWPVEIWKEVGCFSEDYLDLINEHWLQFAPPPQYLYRLLGGFYTIYACIGCWGNVIVLFMYVSLLALFVVGSRDERTRASAEYTPQRQAAGMSLHLPILLISLTIAVQCIDATCATETKEFLVKKYKKAMCDGQTEIKKPLKCYSDFLWRHLDRFKVWKKRKRMFKYRDSQRVKRRAVEGSSVDTFTMLAGKVSDGGVNPLSVVGRFKLRWPVAQWRQYGLFTDDYLLLINPHWLGFAPPAPAVHYALGGLYIVLFAIGCCGNFFVLLMYFRCRTLRTPGNILVANLALSDFFMLAKTPIFIFNSFNFGPALGKPGCVIYGFLGGLTGATSIATLSAIALDRYWAVVRPLEPLRALTAIRARLLAAGAWLYAALFALIPALDIGYGRYVPEGYLTSCSFDYLTEELPPRYFIFVFFCAAWVLPLCTISYCYLNILHVVAGTRNVTTNTQEHLSFRHIKEQAKKKAEIKLAVLVIAVIVLFFVSWTPYAVVALLGIFGKKELISPLASMIPALFCKTAACINPFIYIITHPKFRKEFKKLLFTDKSKRMGRTTQSKGYTVASTKGRRISKELSESDDVEVLAMEDIPFQTESLMSKPGVIKSISSKICARQGSQRSMSMKSFEESAVTPPSWYAKPQFVKRKSLRLSLKSNS